jgi:uncharacterized protein (DUF3084 family)
LVEVRLVSKPTTESPDDPGPQAAVPDEPEPELQADRILADGDRLRLERRAKQVAELEAGLSVRVGELDRRENELRRREAELEAAFGVREDRIEQREGEVADAQAKLERREQELNTYVTRLQAEFSRRA